jgi:aminopeptidase N
VAGFNFGDFKMKELKDPQTQNIIEGYATKEVPDYLKRVNRDQANAMSPTAMMDRTMSEAQGSMQLFTSFFGPSPYGRVAITQQPAFNYGQSWPTLVYLPVSAFLDSTQRYMLMGSNVFSFGNFIQELTPHEVAHQWWGHIVGWSSYRDQWLSEGFADFSASLFIQATNKTDREYRAFLKRWSDAVLLKQSYGSNANDIAPISAGARMNSEKAPGAYAAVVYNKGGAVLHMLRSLMYNAQTGDQAFKAMMQDFVKTHTNKSASTDDFKAIVEKHMQPHMNLADNGKMDWFFNQWVHGTEVPKYKLTYSLTPQGTGSELKLKLAQSNVSGSFMMPVRLYASINDRILPILRIPIVGNKELDEMKVQLPFQPKEILMNYNYDVLAYESVVTVAK